MDRYAGALERATEVAVFLDVAPRRAVLVALRAPRGFRACFAGKSHHRSTAKRTASLLQPSDGLILEIGPRLEDHLPRFSAIQTHPSCRFHLAADFSGLRRRGS